MLRIADTTVPATTTAKLINTAFGRSSGFTSPMNGATATNSTPCSKPNTPPANAVSVRSADLVKLRERATHDIPTQQAISQATGVAHTTPGCPRSKATKITAAAQVENGRHTAFPMDLESKFVGVCFVCR